MHLYTFYLRTLSPTRGYSKHFKHMQIKHFGSKEEFFIKIPNNNDIILNNEHISL